MEFEIKERTQVKAVIYGRTLMLRKPTIGQIEWLQSEMAKGEQKQNVAIMKKFGVELGVPAEVCDTLELDHFVELIETLTGGKKK